MTAIKAQPPVGDSMYWSAHADTVAKDTFLVAHSRMTIGQLQQALFSGNRLGGVGITLTPSERELLGFLVTVGYPDGDGLHRWTPTKQRSVIQSIASELSVDPDNLGKTLRKLIERGFVQVDRTTARVSYLFHEFVAQALWRRKILATDAELVMPMAEQIGWDSLMKRLDAGFVKSKERNLDPSRKMDRLWVLRLIQRTSPDITIPEQDK